MKPIYEILILSCLLLASCVTEESPKRTNLQGIFDATPTEVAVSMPKPNDAALDVNDPCYINLENLVGSLLVYHAKHNALPESLDEISKISPEGDPISLNCPGSGKPYIYFAQGFQAPKVHDLLILFDPDAVHRGNPKRSASDDSAAPPEQIHYGVVMEPIRPNAPVKMFVVPLRESLLDYYIRSPQPVRQKPFSQIDKLP